MRKALKRIALALFALSALSLLFLGSLYVSDTCLHYFISETNNRFEVHVSTKRLAIRNFLLNTYPSSFFGNYQSTYPVFSIDVSSSAEKELESQVDRAIRRGYSVASDKRYVAGVSETDSMGIKLHGTTQGNFIGSKKSWSIKSKKERFNLITPKQHHYIVPLFANYIAKELDLQYNTSELVALTYNGKHQGLYWKEEKINDSFLENRGLDSCVVVALNNNWINVFETGDWSGVCHANNVKRKNRKYMHKVVSKYTGLITAIESEDADSILVFFEPDYLSRFEAYRNLLGVCHDIIGDNLRMYFNNSTEKFYPIVRSEGDLNQLQEVNGSLWDSYNNYGNKLVQQHHYLRMFRVLNSSLGFVQLKNQHLAGLINEEHKIMEDCTEMYNQNYDALCYDRRDYHSIREKKLLLATYLSTIKHNLELIKKLHIEDDK